MRRPSSRGVDVIPVLVTGIHPIACSGVRGWLDPGNKFRDDICLAVRVP
jgi:hypothetical protein